jgi:hypothetical protein
MLYSAHPQIVFITTIKCLAKGSATADLSGGMEVMIERISIEQLKKFYLLWQHY